MQILTQVLLCILGFAIVSITLLDVIQNTLLPRGGGIFSERISSLLWRGALWLHHRRPSHQVLSRAGVLVLLVTVVSWAVLLWLGWTLIFSSSLPAVVESPAGTPGDVWARLYFTGYTLITLGLGDYKPQGAAWQILTVVASASGFFLATLAITYLLSVISAVVQDRGTALYISSLGKSPHDILRRSWNGEDCSDLTEHLTSLMEMIGTSSQQHLAYPIVHYFHSTSRSTSSSLQIASLDQALGYLEHGLSGCRDEARKMCPLQDTISEYLETLEVAFINAAEDAPEVPSAQPLREHGLQTVDEVSFQDALGRFTDRRKLLLALVEKDGWTWDDVWKERSGDAPPDDEVDEDGDEPDEQDDE